VASEGSQPPKTPGGVRAARAAIPVSLESLSTAPTEKRMIRRAPAPCPLDSRVDRSVCITTGASPSDHVPFTRVATGWWHNDPPGRPRCLGLLSADRVTGRPSSHFLQRTHSVGTSRAGVAGGEDAPSAGQARDRATVAPSRRSPPFRPKSPQTAARPVRGVDRSRSDVPHLNNKPYNAI